MSQRLKKKIVTLNLKQIINTVLDNFDAVSSQN